MLFQRLATALLLLAIFGSATSLATSTETSTETSIKRAPIAKPFKTKTKGHKSRTSSKTASTKSLATKPTSSKPTSTTHTTTAATLRPARLTSLGSREVITARVMHSLASPKVGIENPRALQPFFDQLHQLEADPNAQLVRVIQFGTEGVPEPLAQARMVLLP